MRNKFRSTSTFFRSEGVTKIVLLEKYKHIFKTLPSLYMQVIKITCYI